MAKYLQALTIAATILFLGLGRFEARAANYFGAIAYSTTSGAYGYSYDYAFRSSAEERALSECESRGEGCEVVIWFRNACGALATSANGARGWAWANNKEEAKSSAIDYCEKHGGRDCRVLCWSCATRP